MGATSYVLFEGGGALAFLPPTSNAYDTVDGNVFIIQNFQFTCKAMWEHCSKNMQQLITEGVSIV